MSAESRPTDVLEELRSGTPESLDKLSALLYAELREIAHRHRRARDDGATLATPALLHALNLTPVDQSRPGWNDRAHFLALAAVAMRHILADRARTRIAIKRGGAQHAITLDEQMIASDEHPETMLEIDQALERLAKVDPRLAAVVQYRFFGGLTNEEIAEVLGVTTRTVERDWTKARMLLKLELMV
jgi:RNA polymerase sigma factor (TIGR02999 family)